MNLGIILALGDSFKNMAKSGQDSFFKKFYLSAFSKEFEKVIIFSYENEQVLGLPHNVRVIPNKYNLHRFIYAILLPLLNLKIILECNILRVYHLFGIPPAIIAKLFFGKPFIFNYAYDYEKIAKIEAKRLNYFLLIFLKPIAFYFASKIFVANKQLMKKVNVQKSVFLSNGTDVNFFKPLKSTNPENSLKLLSVGRLEKQKNFENLIMALKGLKVQLIIVGQGSLKDELLKIAKINEVKMTIIPRVENRDMPKLYNQADIFVLPSYIEGSPKVLLEAMSCGLPVLGSDAEGIDEVLNGTNGRKCGTSSKSISEAVNYLIKNPGFRVQAGKEARKFIVNNFNLEVLLKKEIKIIKEAS